MKLLLMLIQLVSLSAVFFVLLLFGAAYDGTTIEEEFSSTIWGLFWLFFWLFVAIFVLGNLRIVLTLTVHMFVIIAVIMAQIADLAIQLSSGVIHKAVQLAKLVIYGSKEAVRPNRNVSLEVPKMDADRRAFIREKPSEEELAKLRKRIINRNRKKLIAALSSGVKDPYVGENIFAYYNKNIEVWIAQWMNWNPPENIMGRMLADKLIRAIGVDILVDIFRLESSRLFTERSWRSWCEYLQLDPEDWGMFSIPEKLKDIDSRSLYALSEKIRSGQQHIHLEISRGSFESLFNQEVQRHCAAQTSTGRLGQVNGNDVKSTSFLKRIDSAVKKVNERTDLRIVFEKVKTGRAVTSFRMQIYAGKGLQGRAPDSEGRTLRSG